MSDILEKNLAEVMDKAMETGEKIITIECPCCHKTYYALESEAIYSNKDPINNTYKQLGRKCPHCGLSSIVSGGNRREQELERMEVELQAEKKAQEMLDKNQSSWSDICKMGLNFNDK